MRKSTHFCRELSGAEFIHRGKLMFNTENKKKIITVALVAFVLFVVLFALVNINAISGLFTAIFKVLTPIILGAAFAYMLNPILKMYEFKVFKKMKSKSANRGLSLTLTYITGFLIVVAFFYLLVPSLVRSLMDLFSKMDVYLENTASFLNGIVTKFSSSERFNEYFDADRLKDMLIRLLTAGGGLFETIADHLKTYIMGLVVGIKNVVLAIFISIYILAAKERLSAQVKKLSAALFREKTQKRLSRYVRLADKTFGGFFVGKIVDSLIIGVITFVTLLIFRMPYAVLVSVIVCITNVIPVFGPFIGAIPSFFIIFIANPKKALIFLILIFLIQQLDGNVIGPKILGNSTGISSLGVIVSIVIMGEYFGVVGMIVGVPIFALVVAIIKELIEARLSKAGLPTDTAEYYTANSLVDPHEEHHSFSQRLWEGGVRLWEKIFGFFDRHLPGKKKREAKRARKKAEKEKKAEAARQSDNESRPDDATQAEVGDNEDAGEDVAEKESAELKK